MSRRRAWLCATCAQFTTRPGDESTANHDCKVAGATVALIEYVDSTQAEQLRNAVNASR